MKRVTLAIFLLCFVALNTHCPSVQLVQCRSTCPTTYTCLDDGRCVPSQLAPFKGEQVPGRYVRVALAESKVHTISVNPTNNGIVLGEGKRNQTFFFGIVDPQQLAAQERRTPQAVLPRSGSPVSIAAKGPHTFAVWMGGDGLFRIAWQEQTFGEGRWGIERVTLPKDEDYKATDSFAVVVSPRDTVMIVFHDTAGNFSAIHKPIQLESAVWTLETIERRADVPTSLGCERTGPATRYGVGQAPAATSSNQSVWVSSYDADCKNLRVHEQRDGVWKSTLADEGVKLATSNREVAVTTSWVGEHSSIAVDDEGNPSVAYFDSSLGMLRYASRTTSGLWRSEIVDNGAFLTPNSKVSLARVGSFPSLSIDRLGQPFISYQDATHHSLRAASKTLTGKGWVRRIIDQKGIVGFFQQHVSNPEDGRVIVTEVLEPLEKGGYDSRLRLIWEGFSGG